jgi:hypothetical protein
MSMISAFAADLVAGSLCSPASDHHALARLAVTLICARRLPAD